MKLQGIIGPLASNWSNEKGLVRHSNKEKSDLFLTSTDSSTELEFLAVMHSHIRMFKCSNCFESGAGLSTLVIALSIKNNKFGKLISCESNKVVSDLITERLNDNEFSQYATVLNVNSLDYIPTSLDTFDFAYLDTNIDDGTTKSELQSLHENGKLNNEAIVFIHGASKYRFEQTITSDRTNFDSLMSYINSTFPHESILKCDLSRGLTIIKYIKP